MLIIFIIKLVISGINKLHLFLVIYKIMLIVFILMLIIYYNVPNFHNKFNNIHNKVSNINNNVACSCNYLLKAIIIYALKNAYAHN